MGRPGVEKKEEDCQCRTSFLQVPRWLWARSPAEADALATLAEPLVGAPDGAWELLKEECAVGLEREVDAPHCDRERSVRRPSLE